VTIRLPVSLPPYTPTEWELELPGYPVIAGSWRSVSLPDALGSIPSEAKWRLIYENRTSDEALALLLPWRATGGGQWSLTELPPEVAAGVNDAAFARRLIGTTWTVAREPQKQSVKNGRFTVTIDLVYELTFESRYGPVNPVGDPGEQPVYLGITGLVVVAGLPSSLFVPIVAFPAGPVVELVLPGELLEVAGVDATLSVAVVSFEAGPVVELDVTGTLEVAAAL
jgi:hypothetical protein